MEIPSVEAGVSPAGADAPSENNELVTIAGGLEMEVTKQDGTKETVKVRHVPISKIQQLATAIGWGNESHCIELYCDKPTGWADTLSFDSASAIAERGQEINRPFFDAWAARQAKWKQSFIQGAIEDAAKKISKMVSPSGSSAPQSPTTTG